MDRPLSFYSFFQVFRLSRFPNLLIIAFTQYLAAIFLAGRQESKLSVILDINLFLIVSSTVIIAAAGYLINDYYDMKIDMVNKPQKVIVGKKLERRQVLIWHSIFNLSGILMGVVVSLWIGFFNFLLAFLLWLYSNQLKRLPFLGNFTVAILTGYSLLVLAFYFHSSSYIIFIYSFFAFYITLIREVIKDMEDMKGDQAFGCKTIPVVFGIRKTKWFLYVLIAGIIVCFYAFVSSVQNLGLSTYFIIFLIPFLYLIFRLTKSDTKRHFYFLSQYCKWLMISGVLSMTLIK